MIQRVPVADKYPLATAGLLVAGTFFVSQPRRKPPAPAIRSTSSRRNKRKQTVGTSFITTACALMLLLCSGICLNAAEPATAHESKQASAPELSLEARCALPFGDNAVFQQNMPIPVWGWSLPQAKVEVSFGNQKKHTINFNLRKCTIKCMFAQN